MTDTTNRTIIVTGGSRGIGRAICRRLAAPGNHVFFNYASNAEAAEQTLAEIEKAGGKGHALQVDITQEDQVKQFVAEVVEATGTVDVLVNNAGVTRDGLLLRMNEKDWTDVLDTNLKGAFYCIKHVTKPMMRKRSGRIINISSVVGVSGNAGQANYVSSKAGLIGLTMAVSRELASRNITANAVAPGYIETDMTAELADSVMDALKKAIPLKRVGKPEEVAHAVAFLASDEAAYITGQVLHVNGGMYM